MPSSTILAGNRLSLLGEPARETPQGEWQPRRRGQLQAGVTAALGRDHDVGMRLLILGGTQFVGGIGRALLPS